LLKETTGAFDGALTHDVHITNQTCNPLPVFRIDDSTCFVLLFCTAWQCFVKAHLSLLCAHNLFTG